VFALYVVQKAKFAFDQRNMEWFRRKIAQDLINANEMLTLDDDGHSSDHSSDVEFLDVQQQQLQTVDLPPQQISMVAPEPRMTASIVIPVSSAASMDQQQLSVVDKPVELVAPVQTMAASVAVALPSLESTEQSIVRQVEPVFRIPKKTPQPQPSSLGDFDESIKENRTPSARRDFRLLPKGRVPSHMPRIPSKGFSPANYLIDCGWRGKGMGKKQNGIVSPVVIVI
jgi:hypothetical protein